MAEEVKTIINNNTNMSQYDLTCRLGQFLDPHMVIPLFEFLVERQVKKPLPIIDFPSSNQFLYV